MNEPRKAGRPRKHLESDHHFHSADTVVSDDDKTEEIVTESPLSLPIVAITEDVVENPTIAPDVGIQEDTMTNFYANSANTEKYSPSAQNVNMDIDGNREQENPIKTIEHQPHIDGDVSGWHLLDSDVVLTLPPRNGMPIYVSETIESDGVLVFWKRVRAFANPTKRWIETGQWVDFHTGMKINFEPKYWKERF